jgi:hypothetical protein
MRAGWAIMMSLASPNAAARDSPSALMILARFPAWPRPGDHGAFHGVVRRGGRVIPAESQSFDLRRASALLRIKENPGPPVLPRMLRGSSCQGPERYFYITILFGFSNLEWIILPRTAVPTSPPIHIGFRRRKPMQRTAGTVFQNRSTTQIPGAHHDQDIGVRNPADRRGSKAAVCLTIGGHPIDPASNSSREWRVLRKGYPAGDWIAVSARA